MATQPIALNETRSQRYYRINKEYFAQYVAERRVERAERARILRSTGESHIARLRSFVSLLKSNPCHDCGKTYPPFCMDLNHLSEYPKLEDISSICRRGGSWTELYEELWKCELLCVLCHRLKSEKSVNFPNRTRSQRTHARTWYRNTSIVNLLKLNPCLDCAKVYRPSQMDFDHVKGIKVKNVSNLIHHGSRKQLLEEIAKCELVCALCHRIRTHDRKHK
jgi:hypothetical protein